MMNEIKRLLWEEKYRPSTLDEIILPGKLKSYFKEVLSNIPNLILYGSNGVGKTSLAKILVNELKSDFLFINGSEERGIDILRTKIHDFVSTKSSKKGIPKIVILDESDNLTNDSFQALRGFIEKYNDNARFILTGNYIHKIPKPIKDRFNLIEFRFNTEESVEIKKAFYLRILDIIKKENIEIDEEGKKALVSFMKDNYPSFRSMIIKLQSYVQRFKKIDKNILLFNNDLKIKELVELIKRKDYFVKCREWLKSNGEEDIEWIFKELFDNVDSIFEESDISNVILVLAEYSYKHVQVIHKDINLMAMFTLLNKAKFKKE